MRFLRLMLASAALMFTAAGAAYAAEPKEGVEYKTIETPQPANTGSKKVEVIEFFMYSCPHCAAWDPALSDWVKKNADKIAFKRVNFPRTGEKDPQAHAYLTLEAMGKVDQVHTKIFNAIHVEHNRLLTDDSITELVTKNGIDKAKYLDTFNSFSVQTKMKRASTLINSYKVEFAPTIIIDGKYMTSPSQAGRPGESETISQQKTLAVMDYLVAKAAATKK
jgi:thiol:disulfide interchange protein DsbA